MQPTNYGALQPLPDFGGGMPLGQLLMQNRKDKQDLVLNDFKLAQEQDKAARQKMYQADVMTALASGDQNQISSLLLKYPELKDSLKGAWMMQDKAKRGADLDQTARMHAALNSGRTDLAIKILEDRIAADEDAGQADEDDQEALDLLKSGDPKGINYVKGVTALHLGIAAGDDTPSVVKQLGDGESGDFTLGPGAKRFDREGNLIAETPFAPEYRSVGQGDTLVKVGDGSLPSAPSGPVIEQVALSAVPGAVVTSRTRSAEHNAEVGGVKNSYHLTDQARDFVPPQGMSMNELAVNLRKALPGYQIINEKDHVHVEPASRSQGGAMVVAQGAPKDNWRFLSKEEKAAQGLPAGVAFQIGPNGEVRAPSGQDTKTQQAQAVPATAQKWILDNHSTLREIDRAIKLVEARPQSFGWSNAYTPDAVLQRTDKGGNAARAAVGKIGGKIIHDISGAAVTMSEAPRFQPYVPTASDTPEQILTKLRQMRELAAADQSDLTQAYGPENGYRGVKLQPLAGDPVRVSSIQQAQKLAPGTLYIRPDGKVMRR